MTLFTRIDDHHKSPSMEYTASDFKHIYNNPNNDGFFM